MSTIRQSLLLAGFVLSCGCTNDSTLPPTASSPQAIQQISEQTDPDTQVLAQLKSAGADLTKPHSIEFFLYLPSEAAANSAEAKLKDRGFTVETSKNRDKEEWLCIAIKVMPPELKELQKIRAEFEALAKESNARYDGWGTEVVK